MPNSDNIPLFDAPPLQNDRPLAHVPLKFWQEETDKSAEGREFLKLITEVEPLVIHNNYQPWQIVAWLEEMEYEWRDGCWVFCGEDDE